MRETIFVWDSVNDCVMSELDGSGAVQVTYTNEPQQYGGVISQRRGTTTSTYHADALGSTRALSDSSGSVTDTYLNDAWGNSVASTGTTVNPFKWVGQYGYYTDSSTGQVYVRARMYQPTIARWCSTDPAFSTKTYHYSSDTPLSRLDPSGLLCQASDEVGTKDCLVRDRKPPIVGSVVITYPGLPHPTIPNIPVTWPELRCEPPYQLVLDIGGRSECLDCVGHCGNGELDPGICVARFWRRQPPLVLNRAICDCWQTRTDWCELIASRTAQRGTCPWPMTFVYGEPVSYCVLCEGNCALRSDKVCVPGIKPNVDPKRRGTPYCRCIPGPQLF
ncbi:MAG: RHS repeat-associated core domain-containing protein [Planctomycetaceae bacterium]|jgi:RHS repeat-associated protein|nr:RHS repeat-associated core domain-containing protein [Planctomycetaceae bacterium]